MYAWNPGFPELRERERKRETQGSRDKQAEFKEQVTHHPGPET